MDWKNKKLWMAGSVAAVLVIMLCIFLFVGQAREVNVIEFEGEVGVERQTLSDLLAVFIGMRLEEGDFIQTGKTSHVTMTIDQNKIAKLAENSRASFEEVAEGKGGQVTRIYLESGTLINDIKEKLSENVTYHINTPNATVSVRGTYFVVYVGTEEGYEGVVTKINVYEGSVKVENTNGEVVILYADEEENGKEESMDSMLILPSGNHALVGEKEMIVYHSVDYSGLDESDLKRLEELSKEGKSPISLDDIEAQRKKLAGWEEEPVTEEIQSEEQSEAQSEAQPEEESIAQGGEKPKSKPKDDKKEPAAPSEAQITEEGPIDAPVIEVIPVPQEKPLVNQGGGQGGGNHEEGAAPEPSPSEPPPSVSDPSLPPADTYESLLLQVSNLTQIEGQITDLQSKIAIMEEIANGSGDSNWTGQIQQAKTDISQTQGVLDSVVKVNAVLAKVNSLPQPSQITENDRTDVTAARTAYEGLNAEEKTLFPESSLKKITACEG